MFRRLAINTGSNYVVLVVKIVLTFVLTPIFLNFLGAYRFGIWELVVAFLGYAGLLDLGLVQTVSRYVAKFRAEEDRHSLGVVFTTVFMFLSSIGFVLGAITVYLAFSPVDLSEGGDGLRAPEYFWFMLIIALQVFIKFPGLVAAGALEGYHKYYIKNLLTVIDSVLVLVGTLIFMNEDNALVLLAGISTFGLFWKYVAYFIILSRDKSFPLVVNPLKFSFTMMKELMVFGFKSFIQGVSHRIEARSDIFIIGAYLGPAVVPLYSIPANLVGYISNFTETGSNAMMPYFSDLFSKNQKQGIIDAYIVVSRLLVGLLILLSLGILFLGAHFISIWLGAEFYDDALVLMPYLIAYCILPLLNPLASRYLTAIGRHGIYAKVAPFTAILNITLSLLLVDHWGLVGVAFGSVVPVILFFPFMLWVTSRSLGFSPWYYVRRVLAPVVPPGIVLSLVAILLIDVLGVDSYLKIIIIALAMSITYLVVMLIFMTSHSERQWLLDRFRRFYLSRRQTSG